MLAHLPEGIVVSDRFHGSSYAKTELANDAHELRLLPRPLLPYRGCTAASPRRGIARTTPAGILRATGHAASSRQPRVPIALELGDLVWAGIPCWRNADRWVLFTVPVAYALHYETHVKPEMGDNQISLKSLVRVAEARANHADFRTGRDCRASNARLSAVAELSVRTVQRASKALRLLGVATEVLRGRLRTREERFASWRVKDRSRGWASVWALHECNRGLLSPHPSRGLFFPPTSPLRVVTTKPRRQGGGAKAAARPAPEAGTQLARAWASSREAPTWATRYRTLGPWARLLNRAALHGWTARDVNQAIRDYIGAGNWVPAIPHKPAGLLGRILAWHGNLEERPSALDEAREAQELAAVRERIARAQADSEEHRKARERGREARGGAGWQAVQRELEAIKRRKVELRPDGEVPQ